MKRALLIALVMVAALLLQSHAAFATDCQEITDCLANDVRGSIAALAGVALLIGLIVAPEIFGPIVIAKGIAEAITGRDLLTGQQLDWTDRALGVLPVLGTFGEEVRTGEQVVREGEQLSQDARVFDDWIKEAPSKPTPATEPYGPYEIRHTGPDNFLVSGGGQEVWVDGARAADQHLLEAKYVGDPGRSPYVPDSSAPPFIRERVLNETEDEFRRYAAVVGDSGTPAKGLKVITNDPRAVPYFQSLLQKYNIPGQVVVRP